MSVCVGSGLQSGDASVSVHLIRTHLGETFDRPSFPSGSFLIYLYLSPSWCLSVSLLSFKHTFFSPSQIELIYSCLFASFTLDSLVMLVQGAVHAKTLDTCLLGHVGLSDTLLHPKAHTPNTLSNIEPSVWLSLPPCISLLCENTGRRQITSPFLAL